MYKAPPSALTACKIWLAKRNLDAVIINAKQNKFSHTGLLSASGYLFITRTSQHILVDSRYYHELSAKADSYQLHMTDTQHHAPAIINQILAQEKLACVGFEAEHLSYSQSLSLIEKINAEMIPICLDELRQIKARAEIDTIKSACLIADCACAHIRQYIRPGMTEHQIANELEWFMKNEGAEKTSFDTIVASGIRGAMPHAKASQKVVEAGEFITLDFGAQYQGYCSDMTRTFLVDSNDDKPLQEHPLYAIYQVVLQAQLAAIAAIRPGVRCCDIDGVARSIISAAGYGDFFGHNTGHAIGIDVHENPRFSPTDTTVLQASMLLTVEPGIYLPEQGGVRIEDVVLITENGCEVLYQMPKQLLTTGEDIQ
ncbi:aminopeptidase [Hafnia alvei]|uniref:aminopeptidase n=1 Tax=Hafnia alvei TaxID=569 RepID=UPI00103473CA|nr:aminopeptidase [Hafnia alvei]MDU3156831.1 aminopeptidase [Hafnia alvei]TBL43697.1 aminopeptidase [Hafnia alvei]